VQGCCIASAWTAFFTFATLLGAVSMWALPGHV